MLSRKLPLCFLGAALATTIAATGCRDHHHGDRRDDAQPAQTETQPAQPAQSETVIYNNWEVNTHRSHKELAQRPVEEQREYQEWRRVHPNGR